MGMSQDHPQQNSEKKIAMSLPALSEHRPRWSRAWKGWALLGITSLLIAGSVACGREQGMVAPTLSAITPNRGVQGHSVPVILTGAHFAEGAGVNVTGAQITVSQVMVESSTQIAANFAIPANATLGGAFISVTSAGITTNQVIFTIAAPLAVTSTTPGDGAVAVPVNSAFSANFSEALNCATITASNFMLVAPNGAALPGVLSCSGSMAIFTPSQLLASSATYTAKLSTSITDAEGDPLANPFISSFTTALAPAVTFTTPVNNATGVPTKQIIAASFNQPINCATVSNASFVVSSANGTTTGTVACSGSQATFTPAASLTVNLLYSAVIGSPVANLAGATLANPYAWVFKTAPAPPVAPTVISTNPAKQAAGVPINQKVAATFNEAMDPATINAASFSLAGPGGAAVTGAVTYVATGSIATFTPAAPLAGLTQYTATISNAANSLADTPMASSYVWAFTTGAAPNTTQPILVSTLPNNAATSVPINQAVSAVFSQSMDPATINGTTFTLTAPGGAAVAGLVSYAAIAKTATITPTANLLPSTVYTATISNGAQNLAGYALGAGPIANPWTFTTAAAPDTTKPTILLTNPAAASANTPLNATVNATFSEAMDPLTITTNTFQLMDASGNAVPATVAYDSTSDISTLTPLANLTANTTYTATVTTGAADLAGNPLGAGAVPNPWLFTTVAAIVPPAVNLGTASLFGGFGGGAGMTNQGIETVINGDIGTTGASTLITGFHDAGPGCTYTETPLNIGFVNGSIDTAPPPPTVACPTEGTAVTMAIATQAATDVLTAFNATSPALMPPTVAAQASELGGLTLPPGIYQSASGTFAITNGDLTLDAQGNPNAVWVFQAASSLTVGIAGPAGARNVILINGAQAKNVYWHVGSAATINAAGGGTMAGTILAQAGVSFSTAGNVALTTLDGRALVITGPVTMVNTIINVPLP